METLTLTANLEGLARINAFITEAAERAGLNERTTWQIQLAVDEAATNIIQYAYDPEHPGDITIAWEYREGRFAVTLRDQGRAFDPQVIAPPDLESPLEERQVGGLGIYLMTRLMDEVHFDFDPDTGNVLTMIKCVPEPAHDEVVVVPLHGRIDAVTAQHLGEQVRTQIDAGARYVLLDLSDVTFLNSSGLRTLLLVRKDLMTLGGELRLAAPQPQIHEVFDITGFSQVFAIHPTVEEARNAFGQGHA